MALQTKTVSVACDHSYTLELRLTENSTSVQNNTSSISWSLVLVSRSYNFSQYRIGWSVSLNGSVVSSQAWSTASQRSINKNSELVIISGTNTITHSSDGTLTMAVAASMEISKSSYSPVNGSSGTGTVSLSGSMTLTAIPRSSTMSFSDFTAGTAGAFTITRASSSFTHTIQYKFGSINWTTIVTKTSDTTVSWTPAVSLLQQMTNTASKTESNGLRIYTYSGNTQIGDPVYYNLTIKAGSSAKPTATLTLTPNNSTQNATVQSWGLYIKGLSKINYSISFTGYQGSTVAAYEFVGNSQTITTATGTTGFITSSGTLTIKARVKDSRGRWSDYVTQSITVYNYSQPTISSVSAYRCDSSGNVDTSGTYIRLYCTAAVGASINNQNSLSITYTVKRGTSIVASGSLTSGTASILSGYDITLSYSVTLVVTDSVGISLTRILGIPSELVTFHLKEGGTAAAFSTYATEDNTVDFGTWSPIGYVLGLGRAKTSLSTEDFDTLIMPGVYGVTNNNTAASLHYDKNCPSEKAGVLRVWCANGAEKDASSTWHYVMQEYIDINANIFIRWGYSGDTAGQYTWNVWKQVTTI